MISLPPFEFTFGKYGTEAPFSIKLDEDGWATWYVAKIIIGYCNSLDVEIRPRTDCMAVMIEEDGWQSWCHVPYSVWKKILKKLRELK